jgi:2-methylcitrate dehydratase PrpD
MTLSSQLAARAVAPVTDDAKDRLRALTLTNVAAAMGELGRAGEVLERLPLDERNPGSSAFLHAARLHARTQDDFHPAGRVHVGAVTLAVALALADVVGERLLDCLAAGYETMCAVATVYSPDAQRRGYRPTGVFGPIGAAAAAGVALGLDADGIANAIGLAAARSGGTMQSWVSGTDEWMLEVGSAARAGVEAALFTQAGAVAAPDAFEGRAGWARAFFGDERAELLAGELDLSRSYIGEVAIKPYPVSGIAQIPTDLGRLAHDDLAGKAVESAVIRLSEREAAYPGSANTGPFRSRSDALMSVAFCVACTLTDGTVRLARLERPNELSTVTSAIRVQADSGLEESQAVLALAAGGADREYAAGDAVLFEPWAAMVGDSGIVARRSEADPARVARAAQQLQAHRPDGRELVALVGGVR